MNMKQFPVIDPIATGGRHPGISDITTESDDL